jgi:hypothetical protein
MFSVFKKKPIIEFYCISNHYGIIPEPKPASKYIADWYKRISPTIPTERDAFGGETMTAKKCLPMLDAMSLGYVIPLSADVGIMTNNDCSIIEVTNPPGLEVISFHTLKQLGGKTAPGAPADAVKFINHWIVKTAPGWSTLFLPLINDIQNKQFTCLSALVDTDKYPKEINFPAIWHATDFDEILPAGTPLVVAIPIKRSSIKKDPIIRKMTDKEFNDVVNIQKKQDQRRHVYTQELREPRK